MNDIFQDISKYYAASLDNNVLTVGKIFFKDGEYSFTRDKAQSSYNLDEESTDDTRMVHLVGEVHPRISLQKLLEVEVTTCLFLAMNDESDEIEVRSIHQGIGASIYIRRECPLIKWNPNYKIHRYFDVMDVQNIFTKGRQKNSFIEMLAESLHEFELAPPLLNLNTNLDVSEQLHNPRIRG